MRLVILESPLAASAEHTVEDNVAYAKAALLDSLSRGESPIASHLLYPLVLDDNHHAHRQLGMHAGWAWYRVAEACIVYTDHGISKGMSAGMRKAREADIPIEMRSITDAIPQG